MRPRAREVDVDPPLDLPCGHRHGTATRFSTWSHVPSKEKAVVPFPHRLPGHELCRQVPASDPGPAPVDIPETRTRRSRIGLRSGGSPGSIRAHISLLGTAVRVLTDSCNPTSSTSETGPCRRIKVPCDKVDWNSRWARPFCVGGVLLFESSQVGRLWSARGCRRAGPSAGVVAVSGLPKSSA